MTAVVNVSNCKMYRIVSAPTLTYIKLVIVLHECVMKQVAVDLGFDQNQVNEEHDEIVLDILVAKVAAISADGQADVVPAGLVIGI